MTVKLRLLFTLSIITCWSLYVQSQTFRCDGRLQLVGNTGTTTIYSIWFGPFFSIGYIPISLYSGQSLDALGFNPKDNYIYGVQENTNAIVRLRSDGSTETIGTVPLVSTLRAYAGDCTPEGYYVCHDVGLDQLLFFNVIEDFSLAERVDMYWNPDGINSGPFETRLDDFAIDPNNPRVAYAVQAKANFDPDLLPLQTGGYLLEIIVDRDDPNVGMVTPIAPLNANIDVAIMGSMFYKANGGLYGYGAQAFTPGLTQNRLLSINPQTAVAGTIGTGGPWVPISDGCSCPYNLSIAYTVEPLVATCTDDEVTYFLKITNRSNEPLANVTLTDTIPEGMIIEDIYGNVTGAIDPTTGVGTRFLTINGLSMPPRSVAEMTIQARIDDIPVGRTSSQVYLRNLPSLFGGEMISDDPNTSNTNDPAHFEADAIFLEDIVFDVTSPTDCLSDNDGTLFVTGPQLLPGVAYEAALINEPEWETTIRDVIVDEEQSFFLDSLASGRYRLDRLTPVGVRCSYEWKDTTINIEPPNEQLMATLSSNAPLCAGNDLELKVNLFPGGTVLWGGPALFRSVLMDPVRASSTAEYSGTYDLTATYGACEQERELEVLVAPAILASIGGQRQYCEREFLRLKGRGNGDFLTYQWTGPNGLATDEQFVESPSVTPSDEGIYQVVLDNSLCQDTARLYIDVLPSPTIEIPKAVEADFCDPVSFQPTINGDDDVVYAWSPAEGLSCVDCPEPEVLLPILPNYQLQVVNDFGCTDSVNVRALFRSDDLIYIPNAFSPNIDNINDYFELFPSCAVARILDFQVYNRWGQQVFSNTQFDPTDERELWDGQIGEEDALPGVYLWNTTIELIDGTTRLLTGEVNLLR